MPVVGGPSSHWGYAATEALASDVEILGNAGVDQTSAIGPLSGE